MWNRLKWLGLFVVVAAVGFFFIAGFARPTNVVSKERFKEGLSLRTELGIETSFGVSGIEVEAPPDMMPPFLPPLRWKEWRTEEGVCLRIGFNEAGELVAGTSKYDPSWIQKIQRWLRMSP
jgi:hypothetical protein